MSELLHELIHRSAQNTPAAPAIHHRNQTLSYAELDTQVSHLASALRAADLLANERVAVYLPKRFETDEAFTNVFMAVDSCSQTFFRVVQVQQF